MKGSKKVLRQELEQMRANLDRGLVISVLSGTMAITFAGMMEFYKLYGVDGGDALAIQGSFWVVMGLCSVPLGYLADIFGKRRFLLGGIALTIVGYLWYASASTFSGFLVAEILIGLGLASSGGADGALMYASMQELRKSHQWRCLTGKMIAGGALSSALAHLCGGYLSGLNYRAPFLVSAAIGVLLLIIASGLTEPPRRRRREPSARELGSAIHLCFRGNPELRWILLAWTVLGVSVALAAWVYDPYLKDTSWSVQHRGCAFAVSSLIAGAGALCARYFPLGDKWLATLFALFAIAIASGHLLLGSLLLSWGILFALPHHVSRGAIDVIFSEAMNRQQIDAVRATVQAIRNALSAMTSGLLMLGLNVINSFGGYQGVFLSLGVMVILATVAIVVVKPNVVKSAAAEEDKSP